MLVQIFFIIFMLLGMTALYVDMGIARLTQSQMQNAADAAALEGLKNGRDAAASLAALTSAGAVVNLNGSSDDELNAYQRITGTATYIPQLATNDGNSAEGDMVVGNYHPNQSHLEPDDYQRADFIPDSAGSAFLVRLRRTNDFAGLDNQPDVSSSGPALPLLFGRGTFIQGDPDNNPNNYNPRVHGITVRATAIADASPALRVGSVTGSLPGVTSASIERSCWDNLKIMPGIPPASCFAPPAKTVGDSVDAILGGSLNDTVGGYMPVFDSAAARIVGFGFVRVVSGTVTRINGYIAAQNATALVTHGLSVSGLSLLTRDDGALLVPVIAR